MRQICNSATRQNTRGKIFDVVIAMRTAGRERFNELLWHHKFHKRKYLPSKRIAPLVFFFCRGGEAECYFPKSVNRNSAGDLPPVKIFFSAETIARIKIDELYMRERDPLLHYYAPRDAVCNENALYADP